ncbi:MAG: S24 family peptidase [Eubacteriales bacterium]|nr:S24 family peptidase [Eubacteriales bacterium]MDD4474352.1 S24 family peptidase [Eubacteriales bacterium]
MRIIDEDRLKNTLDFILDYQKTEGKTPTYRQIQHSCNYTSLGTVAADVARLKKRNLIDSDSSTGWNSIKIPSQLASGNTHNTLVVGSVRCGEPSHALENIEASVALPDAIFGCADHVILHAVGPSMIKRGIFDGDLLVVRRQCVAEFGQTVIAILDGDSTCKIYASRNGVPFLKAANDTVDNRGKRVYDVHPKTEWTIYGVVDFVIHAPVRDEL